MKKILLLVLAVACAAEAVAAEKIETEQEKTLYSVGLVIARQLSVFNLAPGELETVLHGINDGSAGTPRVELASYQEKVQELAKTRRKIQAERLETANQGFRERAAREEGALKRESGVVFRSLKEGTGKSPALSDVFRADYRCTLPDGKEVDSSAKQGKALEARVDGVIKCLTEGLQLMKAGGKAKLVCPPNTAYGDTGAGDVIPPGATLVFNVDLLEVK